MNSRDELAKNLELFRSGKQNVDDLSNWVLKHQDTIKPLVSRTAFLKIKRNEPEKALKEILPSCRNCSNVFAERDLPDKTTYERCQLAINNALTKSYVVHISEPSWHISGKKEMGGAGFFSCCTCGDIWKIVLPERASVGCWRRIG